LVIKQQIITSNAEIAADWYISKQNGNDSNSGTSKDDAWQTFAPCNAAIYSGIIREGDTIHVGPGTYTSGEDPYSSTGNHIWAKQGGLSTIPVYFLADPNCQWLTDDTPGPVQVDFVIIQDAVINVEGFDIFSHYGVWSGGIYYYGGSVNIESSVGKNPGNCIGYLDKCKIAESSGIGNANGQFTNCLLGYAEKIIGCVSSNNNNSFHVAIDLKIINCTLQMSAVVGVTGVVAMTATDPIYVSSINNIFINFSNKCGGVYNYYCGGNVIWQYCDYNHYEYYEGNFGYGIKNLTQWQADTGLDGNATEGWTYLRGFYQNASGYKLFNLSPCVNTGAPTGSFGLVPYFDIEYNLRSGSSVCKGCYEFQDIPELYTKTYYVRTSGDNANDGLSPSNAWKTIRKATDTVSPYDIVYIGSGTYDEGFYASISGSYTTWVGDKKGIYTGDLPGDIKIKFFLNMSAQYPYYLTMPRHHIRVSNIYFYDFFTYIDTVHAGVVSWGGHGLEFEQCRVDHGFFCGGVWGCKFINNVAWASPFFGAINYARYAMYTANGCANFYFHNTFIHPHGRAVVGGYCFNGSRYDIVINNIMKCVKESSAPSVGSDPVISIPAGSIDECIFDGNFYQYGDVGQVFAYEGANYWDTLTLWQSGSSQDLNSYEGNPLFEGDGFHIKVLSPCVDNALIQWTDWDGSSYNVGVYIDYDLQNRPMGLGFDIGCDEVFIKPIEPPFAWSIPKIGPILIRRTPYREPQLKWPCTHYLPNRGQFTLNTCPRCLGTGFYYDIQFDAGGLVPQVWDETKLAQELEKITITDFNPFHPEYGANLKKRVGQVPIDDLKPIIKSDLLNSIFNLMKYQKREANKGVGDGYFSPRELIDSVKKVEITEISTTELEFTIYILTVEGKELEITGKVLV